MTVVAVVAIGLIAGLLANRYLRPRVMADDEEGSSVRDLISPMETLTVLLLAFVLVVAADSFDDADDAADAEAEVLDHMSEVAVYLPEPQRQQLLGQVTCYARAISQLEWMTMREGSVSRVARVWSTAFRQPIGEIADDEPLLFEILIAADKERSERRGRRLSEAVPAIPNVIFLFMLLTLAATVMGFAFSLPRVRNGTQILTLLLLAGLFTLSLLLIRDVDRPFEGLVSIPPTAMLDTAEDVAAEYVTDYGPNRFPCDDLGQPI
ncbi:MAG: hypothetical protein ACRD0K_08350 [Egibacteraceae bacterium]